MYHSNKNSFCISGKANAVKIASDFEPPPRRKISARQRAKNSEFVWKNRGKSVGRASRVPPSGFEKAVEFCIGTINTLLKVNKKSPHLRVTSWAYLRSPFSTAIIRGMKGPLLGHRTMRSG